MGFGVKVLGIGVGVAAVIGGAAYYERARIGSEPQAGHAAKPVVHIALESSKTVTSDYVTEGGIIFAIAEDDWWKELRGDGDGVVMVLEGAQVYGRARAVEDDDALRAKMFARLRPDDPSAPGVLIEIKPAPFSMR